MFGKFNSDEIDKN